jgi:hypothetical protein
MTLAQLIECLLGKVAAVEGLEADGTPFNGIDIESIKDKLEQIGYKRDGTEYLYNGMTGQKMKTMIFIGPTFYQRLKHLVLDKLHCLSMDHEVLTFSGWKTYDKLTMDDDIATLKDGELTYEKPTKLIYYPKNKGKMYQISNSSIDLKVTPDHRMWVSVANENGEFGDYQLIEVNKIVGKHVKYQTMIDNKMVEIEFNGLSKENITEIINEQCPVFCLQVPSEVFMVRRNGKCVWTGNSRGRGPRTLLTRLNANLSQYLNYWLVSEYAGDTFKLRENPKNILLRI